MQSHLAFLHTSPVHVDTFNRLIAEAASELPIRHIIEEQFLTEAQNKGITQNLNERIRDCILYVSARFLAMRWSHASSDATSCRLPS